MAKPSSVHQLPSEVKAWLDAALIEGNFSGYQAFEDELRARGFNISKSAINRYGQKLEQQLAAIKASTEAARILTEGVDDKGDSLNGAVMAMIQTGLFNCLVDLQQINDESLPAVKRAGLYASLAKNVSYLSSVSIDHKKYQAEVKEKVQTAAAEVEKVIKRGGLSDEAAEAIRRQILGIAS